MTNETIKADVAIVGYGPTGQILALMLGRMGHTAVAIDRWPDLYPLPRAVHFDHEIGRILQKAGIADDIMRITEPSETYQWVNADRKLLLEIDWHGRGPSGWPAARFFSQPDMERVIDGHVKRTPGVRVLQGWSAQAMSQSAEGVRLEVERGVVQVGQWKGVGEKASVEAKWLVGADGANSFVRRNLGIEMHDLGFAFDWLVVDVIPPRERVWDPKTWQWCNPVRPTTVVPGGPGRRRWEFMALPGEKAVDMNKPEVAWSLLEPWDITPANSKLERHAIYTFRGQWADSWRQGRALLAGDAAHLMPPFAGQGLCSGMRDSMALAWRLDGVLRGRLPESVLDSYGPERSGHVQQMIGLSIELGKVICVSDPQQAAERDRSMMAVREQPDYVPMPPPAPRLGEGLWTAGAPGAGQLGVQGFTEVDGGRGRFDDLFGTGFHVIARDAATVAALTPVNREALARQAAIVVHLGAGGIPDVDGSYTEWLDQLGCVAAFGRPDFYLQGGARDAAELNHLVDDWRAKLAIAV